MQSCIENFWWDLGREIPSKNIRAERWRLELPHSIHEEINEKIHVGKVPALRVLAVDWGSARIGLAVGESETGIASAKPNLLASGSLTGDAEAIMRAARAEGADRIVVGLPVNPLSGGTSEPVLMIRPPTAKAHSDGLALKPPHPDLDKMERLCASLAERLREGGWDVDTIDETLSSHEADTLLKQGGLKAAARSKRIDGQAAAAILQRYFESNTSGTGRHGA